MKKEKGMKFKVYDRVDPATLKSIVKELGKMYPSGSGHQHTNQYTLDPNSWIEKVNLRNICSIFSFWGFEKVNLSSHFPILVIPSPQKNENENRKKNAVYELSGSQLRLGIDVMNDTIFMI